jgi:hypothetical protein
MFFFEFDYNNSIVVLLLFFIFLETDKRFYPFPRSFVEFHKTTSEAFMILANVCLLIWGINTIFEKPEDDKDDKDDKYDKEKDSNKKKEESTKTGKEDSDSTKKENTLLHLI